MTSENILAIQKMIALASGEIMSAKNHDYKGGSGDGLANFKSSTVWGISNTKGILLRITDKLMRIKTFDEVDALEVKGESVIDAVSDIINYSVLILCILVDENKVSLNDITDFYNKHLPKRTEQKKRG